MKEHTQKRKEARADEELNKFYGKRQIDSRKQVVESETDDVEPVVAEPGNVTSE